MLGQRLRRWPNIEPTRWPNICIFNVGQASQTVAQHQPNIGSMCCVCCKSRRKYLISAQETQNIRITFIPVPFYLFAGSALRLPHWRNVETALGKCHILVVQTPMLSW